MGSTSKINHNRTTVPKEVRDFLKLEDGEHLYWEINEGIITVSKVEKTKKSRFEPF